MVFFFPGLVLHDVQVETFWPSLYIGMYLSTRCLDAMDDPAGAGASEIYCMALSGQHDMANCSGEALEGSGSQTRVLDSWQACHLSSLASAGGPVKVKTEEILRHCG